MPRGRKRPHAGPESRYEEFFVLSPIEERERVEREVLRWQVEGCFTFVLDAA